MAASKKTIEEVLNVLDVHLDLQDQLLLFKDLVDVDGNASFVDSILAIYGALLAKEINHDSYTSR